MAVNQMRVAALSAVLMLALVLAGCSGLTPAYGTRSETSSLVFNYAEPTGRLQQVVLNELQSRFRYSQDADAPILNISISAGSGYVQKANKSIVGPGLAGLDFKGNNSVYISATVNAVKDGKVIFTATRRGTAQYRTNSQVLSDNTAANEALERAARDAAESLRLAIIAQYIPAMSGAAN